MKKMKEFWESLEEMTTISKRELFLGLVSCALAGIVLGVFFSPKKRKTTIIGSNNGNGQTEDGCLESIETINAAEEALND